MVITAPTGAGSPRNALSGFSLDGNYPNPVTRNTSFSFTLGTASFTTLKIHNLRGEEVAAILRQMKSAGQYTMSFDAKNLPAGVYLYKLQAGKFSQTRKMIIEK